MKLLAIKTSLVSQTAAVVAACVMVVSTASSAFASEPVKKLVTPKATHAVKKPAAKVTASRTELKTKATQIAAGVQAAEAALSPEELAIAQRIHVGQVACELGVSINIKADARSPGYFDIESKKFRFRMFPVVTSTGAIRLQDARADAVWLQLANKSMLMSQKLGSRLADVCMNTTQMVVAAEMEKHPPASLLEPVKVAVKVTAGHSPASEQAAVSAMSTSQPVVEKAAAQTAPAALQQPDKLLLEGQPVASMPVAVPPVAIQ